MRTGRRGVKKGPKIAFIIKVRSLEQYDCIGLLDRATTNIVITNLDVGHDASTTLSPSNS